jgi:anti-anti-sigma factor
VSEARTPRAAAPASPDPAKVVVGRYQRTVVVTVHGGLDHPRAANLGHILADLIDGQGNLSLVVDLRDATAAGAAWVSVLAEASERARRRGGAITLSKPPADLDQALHDGGLDYLVDAPHDSGVHPSTPDLSRNAPVAPSSDGLRGEATRSPGRGAIRGL